MILMTSLITGEE